VTGVQTCALPISPIYRPSEIEAIISALEFREEISIYQ
jgi:hypothetical protein